MSRPRTVDAVGVLEKHGPMTAQDFGAITGIRNPNHALKRDGHVRSTPKRKGAGRVFFHLDIHDAACIERARMERAARATLPPQTHDAAKHAEAKAQCKAERTRQRMEAYAERLDRPCFADEIPRRLGEIQYRGRTRRIKSRMGLHNLLGCLRDAGLLGSIDVPCDARGGVRVLHYNAKNPDSHALALAWAKEAQAQIASSLRAASSRPLPAPPGVLCAVL